MEILPCPRMESYLLVQLSCYSPPVKGLQANVSEQQNSSNLYMASNDIRILGPLPILLTL